MLERDISYWAFLKQAVRHPNVTYALGKAALEHRLLEKEFRRRAIESSVSGMALEFPHLDLPPAQYWQRNFFSILFLSIFEALGMPPGQRRTHGLIVHTVRGIVTAADNILDNEDKGAVKLRLDGGTVLPNILLTLLQQTMLHNLISEATAEEPARRRANTALLGALFEIAREESSEDKSIDVELSPETLLADIHSYRGGRLLELAFVVPEITEPDLADGIRGARAAVHRLGLGLQILDDVTDFADDVTRRNHNMLRSWIVHRGPDGATEDGSLPDMPREELAAPERAFPSATREVLALAIELALQGFERLHDLGHAIDRGAALDLIEMMFHLRDLAHLWRLYDGNSQLPASLVEWGEAE